MAELTSIIEPQSLVINQWEFGMADSPHLGHGMVKLADIESQPGAVLPTKAPTSLFAYRASNTRTFTANAATDTCTASGNLHATAGTNFDFTAATFSTTGTLPAGLTAGTIYFLERQSDTTFRVCTTPANVETNTVINITDAGTGTHTVTPVPIGTIKHIVKHNNPTGGMYERLFAQDSNGRVWVGTASNVSLVLMPGNTITASSGGGLIIHQFSATSSTYLFVFRNAAVDVADVHDSADVFGSPVWTNGWQSLNTAAADNNSHHCIVGQDNTIYFCDSRFVGSIREASGSTFAPGTGSTYVYNNQALDTPSGEVLNWLEELGVYLLAGGDKTNKIYPWDRVADSFELSLIVPEYSIKRLKNIGNEVYILAGVKGNIYKTQGTYVDFVRKVPNHLVNATNTLTATPLTWGGIASVNGSLIFGLEGQTAGNHGLYKLFSNGAIVLETIPSIGSDNVDAIYAETEYYFFGYNGGADFVSTTRYSNFETVLQSGLIPVGDKKHKASYSQLEVQTATPATSGDIRVGYRTDRTSAFTTIATYAADSSATSFQTDAGLIDLENIQLQVEMDGNFELIEVRLLP